jgi:branched-chain amino acid transport system permease protein
MSAMGPTPLETLAAGAVIGFSLYVADGPAGLIPALAAILVEAVWRRMPSPPGEAPGRERLAWVLSAVPLALGLPLVAQDAFSIGLLSRTLVLSLIVLSLNVVTGYGGQISIGHAALVGLGAYGTAILAGREGWHIVPAVLAAGLAAAFVGFLIGIPALRLRGHYLGLVTLAVTVAFPAILQIEELAPYTGTYNGLSLFDRTFGPPVAWAWLTLERWHYLVVLLVFATLVLLTRNLIVSAAGRALVATRDHELAATAAGISVPTVKVLAFVYSAFIAGLAGGLWFILNNRTVAPDAFTLATSIEFLLALVVGGRGSILGSLLGGFFLVYIQQESVQQFSAAFKAGTGTWANVVVVLVVATVAAAWLGGSIGRARVGRRLAGHRGAGGRLLLTAMTCAAAVAIGASALAGFRFATARFLDVTALQPAFAGIVLLVTVLGMPGGVAEFVKGLDAASWRDLWLVVDAWWWPVPAGEDFPQRRATS